MPRGFASLPKEERIENARRAGRKAHELGKAHHFTPEEAAEAGRIAAENKRRRKAEQGSDAATAPAPSGDARAVKSS